MFESVQPGNIGTPQYRKCADVVWPNFLEFLPLSPTDAPGRIDLRTAPQPDADALIDLAARALSEEQLSTEGGERPQVVLTMSLPGTARPNWLSPAGAGWTDQRRYHPPTRPRRRIIPVVLGSRGEPLDVARTTRTLPTAIHRDPPRCQMRLSGILRTGPLVRHPPHHPLGRQRPDTHHALHLVPDRMRIRQ